MLKSPTCFFLLKLQISSAFQRELSTAEERQGPQGQKTPLDGGLPWRHSYPARRRPAVRSLGSPKKTKNVGLFF